MLVGCGVAAFGGVRHWMVNNGSTVCRHLIVFVPSSNRAGMPQILSLSLRLRHILGTFRLSQGTFKLAQFIYWMLRARICLLRRTIMYTHARQSFYVILGVTRHSTQKRAHLISILIRWVRCCFASKSSAHLVGGL
jgi:hypothetical protein